MLIFICLKIPRKLALLPILMAISCATAYQPRAWAGGYSESKLSSDVFEVLFEANAYTDGETSKAYLMYRCAEVTKQNGFDYFIVLSDQDLTTLNLAPNLDVQTKPAHTAKIKLGNGAKPDGANSHVAEQVLRDLGPQIKR